MLLASATNSVLVNPIAERLGFKHVVATNVEIIDGVYTGRMDGESALGEGKLVKVKKWMDSNNISKKEISDLITIWEKNIINIKEDRTKPRIDDKIIISWNALAIIGLIDAYDAFKKQDYLSLAKSMFKELKDNSSRKGKLIHTYKEDQFQEGVLEDYAYLSKASMRLFQATGNISYFDFSKKVVDNALELFNDEQSDPVSYTHLTLPTNREV